MLRAGPALKVTIYLNNDTDSGTGFLHEDILTLLEEHEISGASLIRLDSGFGSHRQIHASGAGSVAGEHLPLMLVFIDTKEKVETILSDLFAMVTDGVVEVQSTEILKVACKPSKVIS